MAGLSFGAWLIGRKIDSIRRPLLLYGFLELGVAGWAIAMPAGLSVLESLQAALFGNGSIPPSAGSPPLVAFGLMSSFALIVPPTAMMGATLPLLAKHVVLHDRQIGPRIGLLYAINTLGAVGGTLAAAFALMPSFGLVQTTRIGALVNVAVFGLIWFGLCGDFRSTPASDTSGHSEHERNATSDLPNDDRTADHRYRWIVWFAIATGSISFCYEIVFTRMLGHLLGGSIFAFATMLAGFLLGLAAGGAIGSRLATNRNSAAVWFAFAQVCTAAFALASFWTIDALAGEAWFGQLQSVSNQVLVSILMLLPTATCIGTTFPLAIRVLARNQSEASLSAAKIYFWNTLGAITGSLLTGMVLLPRFAYHGTTMLAVIGNLSLAIAVVALMRLPARHMFSAMAVLVAFLVFLPSEPMRVMRATALPRATRRRRIRIQPSGKVRNGFSPRSVLGSCVFKPMDCPRRKFPCAVRACPTPTRPHGCPPCRFWRDPMPRRC